MSDTPNVDAIDSAYRKSQGILEAPRSERTPAEKAAAERENEEERIERNSAANQRIRKAKAQRYSTVKRALYEVTESIRHGDDLSTKERAAVAAKLVKELGLPKTEVLAFVEVAASSIAGGDKIPAWRAAESTAERIADSDWRPVPAASKDDDLSVEEVIAKIPRY